MMKSTIQFLLSSGWAPERITEYGVPDFDLIVPFSNKSK